MMKARMFLAIGLFQVGCLLVWAQTAGSPAQANAAAPSAQSAKPANAQTVAASPGEKKFQQYCSRCHNAPTDLPTHVTGTVMMHMRVRASLGAADERDILRYLAP